MKQGLLILIFAVFHLALLGQKKDSTTFRDDSVGVVVMDKLYQKSNTLSKFEIDTTNSKINKRLSDWLIKPPKQQQVERDESFDMYEGMIIDSIFILNNKVYEILSEKKSIAWLQKAVNNSHISTRASIIQNMLLFKPGDKVVPQNFILSDAYLTNNKYISDADIVIFQKENKKVDVYVIARDSWSFKIGASYRKHKNSFFEISETNFLGVGHNMGFRYYGNIQRSDFFTGLDLFYDIKNLNGSFWDMYLTAGYGGKDYHRLNIGAERRIVKPGDFMVEVGVNEYRGEWLLSDRDSIINVTYNDFGIGAGKSFNSNSRSKPFFGANYGQRLWRDRPETGAFLNPTYRDFHQVLGSVGIFSESFYRGNYIYGYGRTESIPYGYLVQLTSGYRWEEFANKPYIGLDLAYGNRLKWGYLSTRLEYGTFFRQENSGFTTDRSIYRFRLKYFSELMRVNNYYNLRVFLDAEYLTGHDTGYGEGAAVNYRTLDNRLKGQRIRGTTRVLFRPEAVLFTPLDFLGFKMAFFAFTNLGTLGGNHNPFLNDMFAEMGIGIRFKNENFVFDDIELKFIIGILTPKNYSNSVYYINNEPHLRMSGFTPGLPKIIEYK